MSATAVEASVKDASSGSDVPVEGIEGVAGLSNPPPGTSLRQIVALANGVDGSAQYATIDSDGNLHVVAGRVSSATVASVAAANTATQLLASRAARVGAVIHNQSSAILYLGFSSGVTAGPSGTGVLWAVAPGATWTLPAGIGYTGAIYGIWDAPNDGNATTADF